MQSNFFTPDAMSDELVSVTTSSSQIFANAPEGVNLVTITVPLAQTLYLRYTGSAATTGWHSFPAGTHQLMLQQGMAKKVRGIGSAAFTMPVTYSG